MFYKDPAGLRLATTLNLIETPSLSSVDPRPRPRKTLPALGPPCWSTVVIA